MKQGFRFDPVRLVPPLAFAALAAVYISQSGDFMDPVSAEAPLLYGKILLALCGLIFALGILAAFRGELPAARDTGIHALQVDAEEYPPKIFLIYGVIAGFIASIFAVGFFVAIPVFLTLFLRIVAGLSLARSLAIAAVSVLFVWLVFVEFLHMAVYPGYLLRTYAGL